VDRPGWNGALLTLAATLAGLLVVLAVPTLREGVANAVSGDDPGVWVAVGAFLTLLLGGRALARRVQTESE
jgi:hypothetical protein